MNLIETFARWQTMAPVAVAMSAEPSWPELRRRYPDLARLERQVVALGVPTIMPDYGRLWLEVDQATWEICGGGIDYQVARSHLHRLYTDRALDRCRDARTRAATVTAAVNSAFGCSAVFLASEILT